MLDLKPVLVSIQSKKLGGKNKNTKESKHTHAREISKTKDHRNSLV